MTAYSKKPYHHQTMADKDVIYHPPKNLQRRDIYIFLLIIALFLLNSPFFQWWATAERTWYIPYMVWGGIIVLIYLCQRWHRHNP